MGNQGTTNWKLIAFFAISVMLTAGLIVGLITDTAIARDGSGTASVIWSGTSGSTDAVFAPLFRNSNRLYEYDTSVGGITTAGVLPAPLAAGTSENQLMFSYRVTTNMAGGQVQFSLPTGWSITTQLEDIVDEKVASGDGDDDPFDRYNQPLVQVYERYGIDATDTTAIAEADAAFRIGKITNGAKFELQMIDGTTIGDAATTDSDAAKAARALNGRVAITATSVTVDLSNEWRAGGEIVILLKNVTTAVPRSLGNRPAGGATAAAPYHSYPVTVKSKRAGRLDLLDPVKVDIDGDAATDDDYPPPTIINVGNILGDRTDDSTANDGVNYYGRDTIARDFTITPDVVYEGETDKTFRVTYAAKGPMYSVLAAAGDTGAQPASIVVLIPPELHDRTEETPNDLPPVDAQNVSVIARGRVLPSGNLSVGPAATNPEVVIEDADSGGNIPVRINIDRIDMGATVTLTYHLRDRDGDDADEDPDAASLIAVDTDGAARDMMVSAFEINTLVPTAAAAAGTATAATLIKGGKIHSEEGSGTMTMTAPSDQQVEAGERIAAITLQYKAATMLMDVDLEVDVKGIVLDDPDETEVAEELGGAAGAYGEITISSGFSPTQTIGDVTQDTASPSNDTVTLRFEGLSFTRAGQTFTITIKNVTARDRGGAVEFTTRVGFIADAATALVASDALAKSPKLYITDTENDAVEFMIDGQTHKEFAAGQELAELKFSFTAVKTAIRNGQVRFTLPMGWTPMKAPPADNKTITEVGQLTIAGGGFQIKADSAKGIKKTPISVSNNGRTLTLGIPALDIGDPVTITINDFEHATTKIVSHVTVQPNATEADKPEKVDGYFWTSGSRGRGYNAGAVEIEVTNAADGYGNATITALSGTPSVSAGSTDEKITVDFTAVGTMDGGAVRLVIPDEWGNLQDDDATLANYVEVDVAEGRGSATANVADRAVIANLTGVEAGSVVRFSYGGGTVPSRNGAVVQPSITRPNAPAVFEIETDGDGNGSFADVRGMQRTKAQKDADAKADNGKPAKPLGAVYNTDSGMLFVAVTGADDGSGTAEVEIVNTAQGGGKYPDDQDLDGDGDRTEVFEEYTDGEGNIQPHLRIHASDMGTYLKFTYTPTQTIEAGQLKFQTHGEWSAPFNSPGTPGYTEFHETGAANIGHIEFDENDDSVTVDIDSIDPESTIEIHYGAYTDTDDGSGAVAPSSMAMSSAFSISVKGGDATTNQLKAINTLRGGPIAVRVYSQASGGGNVSAGVSDNKGDVSAGDADRDVEVVYTAAGQISDGLLKLTIPAKWSHPMMDNVEVTSTGSVDQPSETDFGSYYLGADLEDAADDITKPTTGVVPGAMDVIVRGVNLDAGDTVTFVYSAAMTQPTAGSAKFNVAVDGGSGPGEGPMTVTPDPTDATTIVIGDAAPGSGMGSVEIAQAVTINSEGNTLTFIYTPSGAITDRTLDIRVQVPAGWSAPTDRVDAGARGSFTVTHKKIAADGTLALQTAAAAAVEKIGPFDRQMAARLKHGSSLAAGDQVVFNYENANAPAIVGASTFVMFYGQAQVTNADLTVTVGSGKPATMLSVDAPTMHLIESEDAAMITVELRDEDGNPVPADADTVVNLSSSNTTTGSFMVDGAAATMVTIMAGSTSAMASYTDTTEGTATITAASGTLTDGEATITVTTEDVAIADASSEITDSDGVVKDVARDGDTVTVTARANPGKMVTVMIEGIFAAAGNMDESATSPGTYTRSQPVTAIIPDGTYAITVHLGDESESAGSVEVDNTAPTISAASASPEMVANGDTVTISATVRGATSVKANVSTLDTAATAAVELTDADADGTYTGTHMISAENMAANGTHTVSITAMDDAGNSATDDTATVTLQNSISFTSVIPIGANLFHVPLNDPDVTTVGELRTELGDSVNSMIVRHDGGWEPDGDAIAITSDLGIYLVATAEITYTFEGDAWEDTTIDLEAGANLVGLPVDDPDVTMASDISGLFAEGVVLSITAGSGGAYTTVSDSIDVEVQGDAAYYIVASAAGSAMLEGDAWQNGDATGAAPIALSGYRIENQTPALVVYGSVTDEITGLAREGFRVKVKNLSTKSALSEITSVETADGYSMAFVDLKDARAARVGDVLEISADSPSPLIGVQPVRHVVTVDDVKNGLVTLEDLIAYEIPAETELLRNYPNPFNPETWIPYHLSEDADVSLTIYDVNGVLVRDIDVGHQAAAKYDTRSKAIYWDGRNQFGEQVASGIYFYSLSAGDFSATRKMVILK